MDIATLQKEAHAIAGEQGWWDETTTFGDRIERIHGALSEAGKVSRAPAWKGDLGWRYVPILDDETGEIVGHKPVGVAAQLADVVLLVADVAEHYQWDMNDYEDTVVDFGLKDMGFGEWIACCHSCVTSAWAAWLTTLDLESRVDSFKALLITVQRMATRYGIDLDAAIEAKMEYLRGATR